MKPSARLHAHLDQVIETISRYPVRNPKLFGSAARGDDIDASDIDILVDPTGDTSYFDLACLEMELESILGCRVDVVTPGSLASDISKGISADLKPLQ